MLTHLDLFSGIGGFALAARWAGLETVQFVEIDPFCQKVLQKNFPGVPIHDDIKTFTYAESTRLQGGQEEQRNWIGKQWDKMGEGFGASDKISIRPFLLTGGFPCQPFSCAGKRRGKEDDRFLWPEMLRVISEARPTWVIGENVAGFINMGLDDCISDLEREGYEVQAFVIPACAKNAPHRRDRVWIVAHSRCEQREPWGEGKPEWASDYTRRPIIKDCHAPDSRYQGLQRGKLSGTLLQHGQQSSHDQTSRRNNSWDEPWLTVATRTCVRGIYDGLPRKLDRVNRLKALGNAIVPQIAYEIIKAILEVEKEK